MASTKACFATCWWFVCSLCSQGPTVARRHLMVWLRKLVLREAKSLSDDHRKLFSSQAGNRALQIAVFCSLPFSSNIGLRGVTSPSWNVCEFSYRH